MEHNEHSMSSVGETCSFPRLLDHWTSANGAPDFIYHLYCVFQVWEGKGVVKTGRVMLGETNPAESKPGTIRGDFCIDVSK